MRINRFRRDDRGAAAVEFALVLPILVVLVFGVVDFGRALFAYNYLTSAVREGGRFAAVQNSASAQAAVRTRMIDYLGQLNSLALPAVPAAKITSVPDNLVNPRYITVTITDYELAPITPIPALLGISTFRFSPSAVFRWERADEP
jgi:Flp pilus assembly protein TadG